MIVAIIDYGSGNLRSAAKAFERASIDVGRAGDKVVVTDKASDISSADRVILPGVGAFGDCRRGLYGLPGMVEALEDTVHRKGRPFLGICVGMQLMATRGLEHGEHAGLGWIEGEVVGITLPESTDESALKIPHMGWNDLQVTDAGRGHSLLAGIEGGGANQDRHVYFVHSYHLKCQSPQDVLAQVEYGGPLTAMIGRDNMAGTQFHPEKSQDVGQTILRNFLNWSP